MVTQGPLMKPKLGLRTERCQEKSVWGCILCFLVHHVDSFMYVHCLPGRETEPGLGHSGIHVDVTGT